MEKYTHNYNVILDNMDLNEYRLTPISAITYLQDAFARFCATKKVAAYDLFPKNLYWVVAGFNIEFTNVLPFWSEEIKVEIWISEISKLKIFTDFKLYHKENIFAKGNGCWFILNQNTKRPASTDIIKEHIPLCEQLALGEHKKFVAEKPIEKLNEISYKTNLSDIDFNSHVNNKSYINIAQACISDELKKFRRLKTLNIRFNKESFLNDILTCTVYTTENTDTYVQKITKEDTLICEIQTSWIKKTIKDNILYSDLDIKRKIEN